MNQPDKKSIDLYAMTWRLPIIVWQTIFFVGPLLFMVAMSFFVVRTTAWSRPSSLPTG
jgi:ABC-type spermidine/putrescine transport system permease subunit I